MKMIEEELPVLESIHKDLDKDLSHSTNYPQSPVLQRTENPALFSPLELLHLLVHSSSNFPNRQRT